MSNKKSKTNNINADNWEALSGQNDWDGLLDPLDLDLRHYIIHYGERAGAIGDAFIAEKKSKNCGLLRYPPETLFANVGLEKGNPYSYTVTKYIYAAYGHDASDKFLVKSEAPDAVAQESNVIGYVAYATEQGKAVLGRRDILVVWRPSILTGDWAADIVYDQVSGKDIIGTTHNPKLHKGWYTLYAATNNRTSARDQVFTEVKNLVKKFEAEELSITVAGFSMGAAMATLNAIDMAYNKLNTIPGGGDKTKTFPLTAFVYASPRVGDPGFGSVFADLHSSSSLRLLRINEFFDLVPHLPPHYICRPPYRYKYVDVGQLLLLNVRHSPYIKPIHFDLGNLLPVHNLELYLHDVAGTKGIIGGFDLVVDREMALVNKIGDFLKDECNVVINWWIDKNKSMAQDDNGKWELKDGWDNDH